MEDFRDYLEAIRNAQKLQDTCETYVHMDVEDRQPLSTQQKAFDRFGDFFDMGLMVQNVVVEEKPAPEGKPEREEKPKEKIERLPVLAGICKYAAGHVLLVGRPGSGKTTALERLLVQEAEAASEDSSARNPVLIRLRDVRSTVLEQMQKELQALGLRLATEKIGDLLWAGRFLVLLDGVNELPSGEMRREVESFRREYQRTTPMIFTTRELNVGLDLGIEKKLEMQPLNEKQMQEFTCRYLGQEQGRQLLKGLGQRLREFGETPLLLWMLCGVFRAVGEIPANLGGVFRGFANIYNKNRFDNQKSSEYSRFLQQLAWAMMPQNDPQGLRLSIPRSEAEEIFREFRKAEQEGNALSGAIATLDELLRFHLLRPKDDQEVEFSHQLFQEYYAGEYLLSRLPKLNDLELQKCYLNYLDWTEAIALMAGLVGDRSQAVRLVKLGLEVDLMLGTRLAGEVLPQFQEETVGFMTNWDLPLWLKVELWGKTRSDKAVDELIVALQCQDEDIRRNAAEALGNIGSDRAVNALILALQDQNSDVCRRALYALGNNGSDRAVDALIEILLQDHDWHLSYAAAFFLFHIGSDKAVDALIKTFQDQPQARYVNGIVVETLGKIGSDKATDILILALQDHEAFIRESAAVALGKIGSDKAVDALILALQDKDRNVRGGAQEALGKIGSDKAVDALVRALQDEDWNLQRNVAEALGNIGSDKAVDALVKALQNKDVYLDNVAEALGKIGSDKAVDALIKDLRDQDSYIAILNGFRMNN